MKVRTNKYCVTGVYEVKSFSISEPKKMNVFAVPITIQGIRNDTPALDILTTIKEQVEVMIKEENSNIAFSKMQISNISLIDFFEENVIGEPQRATA